jgi:hypothetical protein
MRSESARGVQEVKLFLLKVEVKVKVKVVKVKVKVLEYRQGI